MKEALRGKNILVADNKESIRKMIKLYLERSGYTFIEAKNGEEVQNYFLQYSPCLIVLEVSLPSKNNMHIYEWIRNERKSDVPIILMGTENSEEKRLVWLKKGANDFLVKPFSPGELVIKITKVLNKPAI